MILFLKYVNFSKLKFTNNDFFDFNKRFGFKKSIKRRN